jgi:predicted Zn-dependent protease with MMP-like domain
MAIRLMRFPRRSGVVPLDPVAAPARAGFRIVRMPRREIKRQYQRMPVTTTRDDFEQMVADALDSIPPELGEAMDNVVVVVEDWPTPEQLEGRDETLLGLYEGVPLTERGPITYSGISPDRITVFQGPLCRLARDRDDLAHNVRTTVLHEVGHYFGMSEERLEELGWA